MLVPLAAELEVVELAEDEEVMDSGLKPSLCRASSVSVGSFLMAAMGAGLVVRHCAFILHKLSCK